MFNKITELYTALPKNMNINLVELVLQHTLSVKYRLNDGFTRSPGFPNHKVHEI